MYRKHRNHIDGDVKKSTEIPTVEDDFVSEPAAITSGSSPTDDFITEPDSSTPLFITHNDLEADLMDHSGTLDLQVEKSNSSTTSDEAYSSINDRTIAMLCYVSLEAKGSSPFKSGSNRLLFLGLDRY